MGSQWEPLTDDEPTEKELAALAKLEAMLHESNAGHLQMVGRDGEVITNIMSLSRLPDGRLYAYIHRERHKDPDLVNTTVTLYKEVPAHPDGEPCERCGVREGFGGCGECGSYSCPRGCRSPMDDSAPSDLGERCAECGASRREWTWYGMEPLGPNGGPAEVSAPVAR